MCITLCTNGHSIHTEAETVWAARFSTFPQDQQQQPHLFSFPECFIHTWGVWITFFLHDIWFYQLV